MTPTENAIIVAGDLCPVATNEASFFSGEVSEVFDEALLGLLRDSRGSVINLETPLTDAESPIAKSGPCLRTAASATAALVRLNLLGIGLANNHVLDQGVSGFADTLTALDAAGIPRFGGGADLEAARQPLIVEDCGRTVGFYACADYEFTIASASTPGANPFDLLRTPEDVHALAERVDAVVVLYHGMKEFYRYPSPEVMRRCRVLIDAGADFVACQHSHCIGCMEEYGGGTILYGQGDFCFCKGDENPMRRDGLLAAFNVESRKVEFVPIANSGGRVYLAMGAEAAAIMGRFGERSREIARPGFVEASWERFCDETVDDYAVQILLAMEPRWLGFVARALRKVGMAPRFATAQRVSHLLNMLRCEAHNEVLATALERRMHGR